MSSKAPRRPARRRLLAAVLAGVTTAALVASCTSATADQPSAVAAANSSSAGAGAAAGTGLFDSSTVHTVSIDYDDAAYQAMIDTFVASGDKEWISATVTIDGTVFTNAGIKLKGNSTLQGLRSAAKPAPADGTAATDTPAAEAPNRGAMQGGGPGGSVSADDPAGLPWRIRLDKFVDGQNYGGETDIVVRGGNTETSLNEAVALELIGAAGLATEQATPASLTVNGSTATLRLVIENPDESWDEDNFGTAGILYKAEAGGDYSYRGDDPASYADVFSVEASTSGEDDYTPLISLLKFLNESDDATFAAELAQHIDIDSFANYLAIQDLVANSDDIDGPGNNSYLRYDTTTGIFTVVAWDQNLSFGSLGGGMGGQRGAAGAAGQGGAPGGQRQFPDDAAMPSGAMPSGVAPSGAAPGGAAPGGMPGRTASNILAERFKANTDFNALYQQSLTNLRSTLYASGQAQGILDTWTAVLSAQATELVSQETITSEAATIAKFFTAT